MNPVLAVLLLVSCTDDFNSCYSNKTMVKIYLTAQACEQKIIPSIKEFTSYGEQIFAQCTNISASVPQQEITLIWSVTNKGNFFLKEQNTDETVSSAL
ncbi:MULTISPECIES: hypothetical protein [unclassified Bartonella]|uniref:hypothetical protein n=1 Tax=unclassified Bartonella TaxID=2645622 RepID=UPI000999E67A|nr:MULTISPECIES: hypothetical protein [unclassified Bartonella]AQX22062.1 hypothetical protein Bho11B_000280 [Bartonella sp. 11B]AQX24660.1 hypothetical protein Bho114_013530 [Bartonella sp. 114]AQX25830.1 hypothetical protein Bco22_011830 [Bartonella sp. Coyote22sub2]